VDDLHLADDVSLAVLHLMMRRARGQPIMVLLIARPGELPQSPQATKLRAAAEGMGIHEIELLPLGDEESLELLQSLIPTDEAHPSPTAQRALLRAAAGYPMVLELLVQDWKASGEQSLALSLDAMTEEFGTGSPPQAFYRQILDRITRSLDNTTHNVLNLAAVLGHRLNDLNMYAIVDLSTGQTMSAMAELANRRVLRDGTQGLEFVNEMVRAAAYIGVSPTLRRVLHGNIADRFIHERTTRDGNRGLEIAWHCIRAGRSEEATPYLLRGAREAIQSGVPYAAERGLSTALPNLTGAERSEAQILLAEALQEQSKWEASLVLLDQLKLSQQVCSTDLAFVLRTKARRQLGYMDSVELSEVPARLIAFMESTADRSSQMRAAVEAASILNSRYTRSTTTPILLETLCCMRQDTLDLDDKIHFLLAKSMLFYNMRDFRLSLQCIEEATRLLQNRNAPNSVLAMLQLGTGAILMVQGEYEASLPSLTQSYQTASRIGNDRIYLQASSNLAISHTRLGEYESAAGWAEQAGTYNITETTLPPLLQAAKSAVVSYAMLGRTGKAAELIRQRAEDFGGLVPASILQAWGLYSADGYAIMGNIQEAMEEGRRATFGENSGGHIDPWAGPYARWVARISLSSGEVTRGHAILSDLIGNLERYDAIDKAEILNAKSWLNAKTGKMSSESTTEMRRHIENLPAAVADQLKRMGMLDFC